MAEPSPLLQAAGSGGTGLYMLIGTLLVVLVGAFVWYLLNQQSAAISSQSMALASGNSIHGLSSAQKKRNNAIVLVGPMGAGKTALWTRLRFPDSTSQPETQTSMSVNAAEAHINESNAYLVDIPGHQKYRLDRDSYLPMARGIIFVVDSTRLSETIRSTAELVYDVLANAKVQTNETPLLLLCNKQDDPLALSNTRVKALLEDEIDKLRASRQAGLDSLRDAHVAASGAAAGDDDDAAAEERISDFLGYDGKKFSFEDLPNPIQFNESTLILGHDTSGLELIESWIADTLHS
ncbi:hypothetical protein GGI01_002925 [Coemansia sp. RSA 376]|nr:hypothetical protein LPJ71_004586 [Coemansia sp. S17]KAJ2013588.1 hypothetical protein GGI14_005303 [Coemansia sp. S680]KAJ2048929.1 hypothetical protein H4S04_003532 [Coemansia sp. S16]KAJ2260548.1 hypothetical protein GGI01_002925 [Coemansia sp. RSA 376]KAJ2351490.1 hypothetical protein GGH92_001799 [Coemansia sp. RSA 2673]KAJ2427272.1 hypothetical protein GGF41_001745 [Coemansia sp. RSA 2531]